MRQDHTPVAYTKMRQKAFRLHIPVMHHIRVKLGFLATINFLNNKRETR